ncbi:MAG: peptidylprolyl isomerase [Nanoarchaeota archaeon]|nr:peptidylprolyl isomerase [Nanoarchaeota archaeon]
MVKKGDFIEIVYTGRIKESGKVFDTNDSVVANKEGLKSDTKPIVVCVGENDVVKGLDSSFEGKKEKDSYSVDVNAENGFGKKDAKQYKLVPASVFKGEMHPVPGLQVTFQNGSSGVIKTVSGGRILVDFNHPLAGHELSYDVKIEKIITDDAEKLKGFLNYYLGAEGEVEINEGKAVIKGMKDVHELMQKAVVEKALKRIPSLKAIEFFKEEKKEEAKEEAKKEESKAAEKKAPVKEA